MTKILPHYKNPEEVFEKGQQDYITRRMVELNCKFRGFLDVGAHVGHWSVYTGKNFYEVTCIEASPENFDRLVANLKKDGRAAYAINAAVYDKQDTIFMKKHHSLSKDPYWQGMRCYINNKTGEYEVKANTLPALLEGCLSKPIDLMKMDIEGFEPVAFSVMQEWLTVQRPVMVLEIEQRWLGRSVKHLKRPITVDSFRKEIEALGFVAESIPDSGDTLFIPKELL
jgi:FkbM family methyltransferase